MTTSLVRYELNGPIATIVMDDGKSNVVSPRFQSDLNAALDKAEKAKAVVLLSGREDVFSAGFDLNIIRKGGPSETLSMLRGGFELSERILSFPTPVVMACTGHALAMGAFLVLSGDYRVGTAGDFKLGTNEVAIGLTMPRAGVEICRQRLLPAHLTRAALLAEIYNPETACAAGFLDIVLPASEVQAHAAAAAARYAELDMRAHYRTKLRVRADALRAIRSGIRMDMLDFVAEGARRMVKPAKKKG